MKNGPTQEIERQLSSVRRRIRRVQLWRGGLWVASVFLLGLVLLMGLDWFFAPLPSLARWAVFLLWALALLWSVWRGFRAFFQKLSLIRIARWLESRHPELDERLSTALELSGQDSASPELVASLVKAAEQDALLVDAEHEVKPGGQTRRWRWAVGAAFLALLLAIMISPRGAGRLVIRSVAPFSQIGNASASSFALQPGDLEVMEGGAVELLLTYQGPGEPEVMLEFADGTKVAQGFQRAGDGNQWRYRIEPVRQSFRYRARSGRRLSDQFAATVWPTPRLRDARVARDYPDYLTLPIRETALGKEVSSVIGTEVTLSAKLNTAVEDVTLILPNGEEVVAELEPSSSETRLRSVFTLTDGLSGVATLQSEHRLGGVSELARFRVQAEPDLAPVVTRLSPTQNEIRVRREEELALRYEIREDYALGKLVLEAKSSEGNGSNGKSKEYPQVLPAEIGRQNPKKFEGNLTLSIAEVMEEFAGARELKVRFRAEDKRPPELAGPGIGYSDWLVIRVSRGAPSLARQEMTAQHDEARSSLQKALHEARQVEQKMRQSRDGLIKKEKNDYLEKVTAEAQEKLAKAKEQATELAERMEQGIHAAKTPPLEQAAAELAKALQEFEKVPLQDEKEERKEGVEKALAHAREAIEKMEEVSRKVNQDHSKIEDLARMEEFAQKQNELARQAEQEAAANPEEKWQNQQKELAKELAQQLYQRPEAMAEALLGQAEQARQIKEEASEVANKQENLSKLADELARGQDPVQQEREEKEIRAALRESQTELANEVARANDENKSEQSQEAKQASKAASEQAYRAAEAVARRKDEEAVAASHEAAESLQTAAETAKEGASQEKQKPAESFANRQEDLAQATEALEKRDLSEAAENLRAAEAERRQQKARENLPEALADAQQRLAEEVQEESESEAVAKSHEAAQRLNEKNPEAAAQAAKEATTALAEEAGQQSETSLESLANRQEELAKAGEQLAGGNADEASEHLQEAHRLEQENAAREARAEQMQQDLAQAQRALVEEAEKAQAAAEAQAATQDLAERQENLAQAASALAEGQFDRAEAFLSEAQGKSQESLLAEAAEILDSEQAAINQELKEQLAQAREQAGPLANELANALPETSAQAQEAQEAFAQGEMTRGAEESAQAAESLQQTSEQAQGAISNSSQPSPQEKASAARAQEQLAQLADRQEQVAEAAQALAEGEIASALEGLQEMAQAQAESLTAEIQAMPQLHNSSLGEAAAQARQGNQQAERATAESAAGRLAQSADQHQEAANSFQKAAQSLAQTAEQLQTKAAAESERATPSHQAPTPSSELAAGFQAARAASQSQSASEAAQQARQAAEALKQAALASRQQMQGRSPASAPSPSSTPSSEGLPQPGQPGEEASESEGPQMAQGDQGVPPELAKLGISVEDWEKIQATLQRDVGGQGGMDVPEDYRGLVKDYFQTMSER